MPHTHGPDKDNDRRAPRGRRPPSRGRAAFSAFSAPSAMAGSSGHSGRRAVQRVDDPDKEHQASRRRKQARRTGSLGAAQLASPCACAGRSSTGRSLLYPRTDTGRSGLRS
ncbi:hypothetical protein GCM10010259_23140 [Streptomyces daghestanicus]|uniref:Uncharacterized protein n=1 Tax=Streptomyces daghestanicus TaxID=66885 RepID=A0ABQ3Q6A7_9ACTN|nr:hypothetical protein GCM10010259_23140 [Streptomyces daghestanicus]GHI32820.1 hypothetical protein Sdagh_45500 [Streptomyces daghestanicus]